MLRDTSEISDEKLSEIIPIENIEYSAFYSGHRPYGDVRIPKTLRIKREIEKKVHNRH